MKKITFMIVACFTLLLGSDFELGASAYQKQDYKTAKIYFEKGCDEYAKLDTPVMTVVESSDIAAMSPLQNRAISDNMWLKEKLYGNDNDGAALRTVKIYEKNGKLRVNIFNQFNFDCELTLDKKGRPHILSNCISKNKPKTDSTDTVWLVKEPMIKLSCFSTKKEDICRGKYTLITSDGYIYGETEMTIAKRKRTQKNKRLVSQASNRASFDCKKASSLVEQAICSDPLLSGLDERLAVAYKKALKNCSDKNALRIAQRSWIKSKRNPCKNVSCLKQVYTLRISELSETIDYTAARFFEDIDRDYIVTIDEISENQKIAMIESGFLRGSEVCNDPLEQSAMEKAFDTSWYVTKITNHSLSLGRCDSTQALNIKIYKKKSGGYLVAIESVMDGSGPKSSFTFFPVSKNGKIGSVLTPEKIGMQVHENEFLSANEQLPEEDNGVATLYRNDDGNIESSPWTWMESKWENRNIVRKIWFEWNGEKFIKRIKKIDN